MQLHKEKVIMKSKYGHSLSFTLALVFVFMATLVMSMSAAAKKDEANLRRITLYEAADLIESDALIVGDVKLAMEGSNPPLLWLRYNIKEIYPLDCYGEKYGDEIYVLYVWTEYTGKVRVQTFNSSCANGSFYSWRTFSESTPEFDEALLNDDICVQVWQETDDGLDGPDFPPSSGELILQGHDGSELACPNE
jgi:hypothetical protein